MSDQNEADSILRFQEQMWEFWKPDKYMSSPPCLLCWRPSVCLHEIVPRSLDRDWYKTFPNTNSIPVCSTCHQNCHDAGADMREHLQEIARLRAEDLHVVEYEDWDLENPERVSKGARPKMGISGRSVFDIVRALKKRRNK